ncbi:MAG: hypothetical protein AB2A00_08845 [Myxococcota bacterium]
MIGPLAVLLLVASAPPSEESRRLAVLPVTVKVTGDQANAASLFLTNGLAAALPEFRAYDVVSMDEVQAILTAEANREKMGCDDATCLTEIAGALNAQLLAVGTVTQVGEALIWSQRVVDQRSEQVLHAASIHARSLQGLVAQIREMAALLCGRAEAVSLKGRKARERLGFTSVADLQDFRRYREEQRELSTSEALTQYIIAHNVESNRLAVAEAAAFGIAAVVTAGAVGLPLLGGAISSTTGTLVPSFVLSLPLLVLIPVALTAGTVGVVLSVVDALNLGRLEVHRTGCCRNDADIQDAENDDGIRTVSALSILAGAPLLCGGIFVEAALAQVLYSTLLIASRRPEPVVAFSQEESALLGPLLLCTWCSMPCLIAAQLMVFSPAGLFLLLWPSPEALKDVSEGGAPDEEAP